jgi:O-antigen/teichoic acid export membrane protein
MSINQNRKKRVLLSSMAGMIFQLVTVFYGLIMPSFYLRYYGSVTNGLISSITQFLGLISFCELGVGAIVQTALYKPLSEGNMNETAAIISEARSFFQKIALILSAYVVALIFIYPLIVNREFDFITTASLILILSVGSFSQYYFGIFNQILLNSDQKVYIQYSCQIIVTVVTAIGSILLITHGASIQVVKLFAAAIQVVRPLFYSWYVKTHYALNIKPHKDGKYLKQKWNGLIHHISYVIVEHTDVVVLTLFSSLTNVSVYYIYYMVVSGIRALIESISAGFQSMLGNIWHTESIETIKYEFSKIEWIIHTLSTIAFSDVIILIIPFVTVYTKGIVDANYYQPLFGLMLALAQFSYCIRLPYHYMIRVAGHYKETQLCAILEAAINLIVSISLVIKFGLVGVAVGTLCAMLFRTLYLVIYLRKNIIRRETRYFIKQILADVFIIASSFYACKIFTITTFTYFDWFLLAIKCSCLVIVISMIVNMVLYKNHMLSIINRKVNN